MVKYARFLAVYLFSLATLTGILLGGAWMWLGFVVIYGVMILGDESLGDYFEEPAYRHPRLLNSLLYFALPALFVLGVAMAWMAGSGDLFHHQAAKTPPASSRCSSIDSDSEEPEPPRPGVFMAWPADRPVR